jgi:hypothetical protein
MQGNLRAHTPPYFCSLHAASGKAMPRRALLNGAEMIVGVCYIPLAAHHQRLGSSRYAGGYFTCSTKDGCMNHYCRSQPWSTFRYGTNAAHASPANPLLSH